MTPAAVPVTLTASERKTLKERVRGAKTPWRDRVRAQVVLAAARGHGNARIAADLGAGVDMVRKWRGRFAELRLEGLRDLPRSGRPRLIPEGDRAAVVALACQLPADTGVPLSRWTGPELAAELQAQGLASGPVSPSSVLRILAEDPVKPWRHQSWIFPRDPAFEAKARVILDLYQGFYQGERLARGDRILSFDAKPSIQARGRIHATLPAAPGRAVRVEHEYVRHGALALLAGLDVVGIDAVQAVHGSRLAGLSGRRLTGFALVRFAEDGKWFADCPVVLDFAGIQVEVCHWKLDELSIGWDTIDTAAGISEWEWADFTPVWSHADERLRPFVGQELREVALLEWRPSGSDLAAGTVAVEFGFGDAGCFRIANGLDENRIETGAAQPDYVRRRLDR
jgi:transposase